MQQDTNIEYKHLEYLFMAAVSPAYRKGYLLKFTSQRTPTLCNLHPDEMERLFDVLSGEVRLATPEQLAELQGIYERMDAMLYDPTDIAGIVWRCSGKRVTEPRGLTFGEAAALIDYELSALEEIELKKEIVQAGYSMGMLYGSTREDQQMNMAKLNTFLSKKGKVKKPLDEQTPAQLKKTLAQLAAMAAQPQD